jgi:uncharacterized protein (DUF1330 family)
MAAYVIMIRERTTDAGELARYSELAKLARPGHDMKAIAFYGALLTLEGPEAEGVVVLEFPSLDAARAWYDSPAYQAALAHRMKGAQCRLMIVEGAPGA